MSKRARQDVRFIFTNPSSNENRSEVIREVRSHAGRWTWQQGRRFRALKETDAGAPKGETEDGPYIDDEDGSFPPLSRPSLAPGAVVSVVSSTSVTVWEPGASSENPPGAPGTSLETSAWGTEYPDDADHEPTRAFSSHHSSTPVNTLAVSVLDPFQTSVPAPLPLEVVSTSDKYSLSILWPGLMPRAGSSHAGVHAWFSHSHAHLALHSAMLFGSYSHCRARGLTVKGHGQLGRQFVKQLAIAEADSISRINRAIQDPSQAVSDAIILSVLCLANNDSPVQYEPKESPFHPPLRSLQWVDVYGRLSPNPIHQAGLAQLVFLRGGLHKIELPGLAAIISFSGILSASRNLSRPKFPVIPLQDGPPPTLQDTINTQDPTFDPSPDPLLSLPITGEMHDVFRAARAYISLVGAYQEGAPTSLDKTGICDHRNLLQWHIMSLLPVIQLSPVVQQFCHMYESCRLALIIFAIGVIFPLPAETAPLPRLARVLQEEVQSYEYELVVSATAEALDVHCWCVVLGGIAAVGCEERAWFVHELRRVAAVHSVSSWGDLRAILRAVLWFDSACNSAGRELWTEAMSLAGVS